MIRLCLALLVSISLALPGAVMASVDHHQHLKTEHSAHDHQHEHHAHAIEGEGEETATTPTCCHMMTGHCISAGVFSGTPWVFNPLAWVQDAFVVAGDMLHDGQSFEADPPPPRA